MIIECHVGYERLSAWNVENYAELLKGVDDPDWQVRSENAIALREWLMAEFLLKNSHVLYRIKGARYYFILPSKMNTVINYE